LLVLLVLWQLWGQTQPAVGGAPVPSRVLVAAERLISSGELPLALLISIQRVLTGFGVALALALPLGLAMGYFRIVERNLDPVVQTFRAIAPIALVPLAILWFGTGNISGVFIVAYSAFFPLIINTIAGVKSVDIRYVRAALTMGLSKFQILWTVILPGALPSIFVGIRLGMGFAWGAIVAAELTVGVTAGQSGGIGYMLYLFYSWSVEMNNIVVIMLTIGAVALTIDSIIRWLQARLMPWVPKT
jgi:ABC-type nitrate/sulfonate/bicarbonate transport system permease component